MPTLTVGVDVSKKTLDAAAKLPEKEEPIDLGKFSNDSKGFAQLKKKVEEQAAQIGADIIFVVLEPTGGYEQLFARFAYNLGWRVSMPNPRHVRKWAEGMGVRAKTDLVDARNLARYGASKPLPDWRPLPDEISQLDRLLKRQDELKESLRQETNRLQSLNAQDIDNGPEIESLKRSIAWLKEELRKIDDDIEQLLKKHPDLKKQAKKLQSIPGVGPCNSLFFLVLMHRWNLLTDGQGTNKAITAYVGLDPVPCESGTSIRKRETISRMGDSRIRALLYLGAMSAVNGNNHLHEVYHRLLGNKKEKKVAIVAVARKILVLIWTIFRNDTTFDPGIVAPASN